MAKTVLILGGNGYIGSRLIHDLQHLYNIQSVDICWFGKNLDFSSIQDYNTLSANYIGKFDAIVLLAGHSSVNMCNGEITSCFNNNINNFINLIAKIDKRQTLIYASSGSVYGNLTTKETDEDDKLIFNPINNYDITKYVLDTHALRFIKDGYNIIGFRFGTVNGWSPNTREELMINSMTKKSIETGKVLINNKDIVRPILGIADVSRAIHAVIENPKTGIYNLASFYDTVENISNMVSTLTNSCIDIQPDIVGAYNFSMNTTKFQQTYNFMFNESINSIVSDIITNVSQATFSNRNKFIKYE
jgi:nucleoside-diphosphate-sugar epimerase